MKAKERDKRRDDGLSATEAQKMTNEKKQRKECTIQKYLSCPYKL